MEYKGEVLLIVQFPISSIFWTFQLDPPLFNTFRAFSDFYGTRLSSNSLDFPSSILPKLNKPSSTFFLGRPSSSSRHVTDVHRFCVYPSHLGQIYPLLKTHSFFNLTANFLIFWAAFIVSHRTVWLTIKVVDNWELTKTPSKFPILPWISLLFSPIHHLEQKTIKSVPLF